MNTRRAIQPATQPAVLSLAFSATRTRFITGLSSGLRCFRTDNCLTTYHPSLPLEGGLAIAELLDDRYLAYVAGGRVPAGKASVVVFWDALLGREINRFDFHEGVLGVRLSARFMVVVLRERVIVFEYQRLEGSGLSTPPLASSSDDTESSTEILRAPNQVKSLYPTAPNPYAQASLAGDLLALPAQTTGQVQLIPLQQKSGAKRVLRAHNSSLRCLALSNDGSLLATASEQGTLLRIFSTKTTDQLAEFRRGVDHAIISCLTFSPANRWLACTSDKGTLHVFDLCPPDPAAAAQEDRQANKKKQQHQPTPRNQMHATHRLSSGPPTHENTSSLSGGGHSHNNARSPPASSAAIGTPSYQGSVQEYYGLRPVPTSASPPTNSGGAGVSALAALKASPWAPKVLKDVRSIASAPFYVGDDGPYWQGGAGYSWTTTPKGGRRRVRNAVVGLPGDESGRPVKGVVAFAPGGGSAGDDDEKGAVMYVVGGGRDARWEQFELLPAEGGGWVLVNRGFRRYLTRQFVD